VLTIEIGSQPTIEAEMAALQNFISEYRMTLNQEGIWLFLATLGCWSVTNHPLQLMALILAVILFVERIRTRVKEKRSFSKLILAIEENIERSLPDGDSQKARLYDLAALKKTELSTLSSFRNTKIFFLCWLFYGASLVFLLPRNVG
jgi:hypothetical protein